MLARVKSKALARPRANARLLTRPARDGVRERVGPRGVPITWPTAPAGGVDHRARASLARMGDVRKDPVRGREFADSSHLTCCNI